MRTTLRFVVLLMLASFISACSTASTPTSPTVPGATETGSVTFTYERPADVKCPFQCDLGLLPSLADFEWPIQYRIGVKMTQVSENVFTATAAVPKGERAVRVADPYNVYPSGLGKDPWGKGISANGKRLCDGEQYTSFTYSPPADLTPMQCK